MGVFGIGTYYLILQIVLKVENIQMASYKGASDVGVKHILESLPTSIKTTYTDFFAYFFRHDISANYYYVIPCAVILFALSGITAFTQCKKSTDRIWLSLLALALPLTTNAIDVLAPDTKIMLLTSGGMQLMIPFAVIMLFEYRGKMEKGWNLLGAVTAAICSFGLVLQCNTDAVTMQRIQDTTVQLANRICMQIEQMNLPEGTEIMIAGKPEAGNYAIQTPLIKNANQYARWGMQWSTADGNYWDWRELYGQYIGVHLNWVSRDKFAEIYNSDEFARMSDYPNQGSTQLMDNVLVIRISTNG